MIYVRDLPDSGARSLHPGAIMSRLARRLIGRQTRTLSSAGPSPDELSCADYQRLSRFESWETLRDELRRRDQRLRR